MHEDPAMAAEVTANEQSTSKVRGVERKELLS
jgi:hypothetical protein